MPSPDNYEARTRVHTIDGQDVRVLYKVEEKLTDAFYYKRFAFTVRCDDVTKDIAGVVLELAQLPAVIFATSAQLRAAPVDMHRTAGGNTEEKFCLFVRSWRLLSGSQTWRQDLAKALGYPPTVLFASDAPLSLLAGRRA